MSAFPAWPQQEINWSMMPTRADEFVLGPAAQFGEFNAINRQSRVFRVTIPVHPYEIVSARVEFAHSHSSQP